MQEMTRMKLHVPSIVLGSLIVAAASLSAGQQGAPNEGRVQPGARLTVERDLEYTRAGGQALRLGLYRPQAGDTTTPVEPIAGIDYRRGAPIGERVADARAAVRWLRGNAARFNIDPGKVGVFGY